MKCFFHIFLLMVLTSPCFLYSQFELTGFGNADLSEEAHVAINPQNSDEIFSLGWVYMFSNKRSKGASYVGVPCSDTRKHESASLLWHQGQPFITFLTESDSMAIFRFDEKKDQTSNIYVNLIPKKTCSYKRFSPGKVVKNLSVFQNPQGSALHAVWTQLDQEESKNKNDHSSIFYSRGSPDAAEWTEPERISVYEGDCSNGDSTVMGAVCCTGPANEVYCAWAGPQGLMFRNLSDKKIKSEKVVAPFVNGWKYVVTRNTNATGLPAIACDNSNSAYRGRIYLCWSDEKHGLHNKNVFVIYSDDQGENWTEPIVVTYRPNHKEQFMPAMSIDQSNGYLSIVYYDQQNYAEGDFADLYLAQSRNGGLKYDYYKVNKWPIKPLPQRGFGKCLCISTVNNLICLGWTEKHFDLSFRGAVIDETALNNYKQNYSEEIQVNKTFTFSDKIKIDFVFNTASKVTAVITKPLEAGFEKVVVRSKNIPKGANHILVDTKKLGLEKGNYTLTLYHHGKNTFVWLLDE